MGSNQPSSLEITDDPQFQQRSWNVQRAGWGLMIVLLFAGMLGALGGAGPLVDTTAGEDVSGATIEYSRFLRTRAPVDMRILLDPDFADSGEVRIGIDRGYYEHFEVHQIVPEPASVEVSATLTHFVFDIADSDFEIQLTFHMEPERPGFAQGRIQVENRPEIEFWQLIYP